MSTNPDAMQQQLSMQQIMQNVQQLVAQKVAQSQKANSIQDIDWSKVSADDLKSFFTSATNQVKQNQLNSQLIMANQLQDAAARSPAQGQSVAPGSTYIPPNPLSAGIGIANQLNAMKTKYNAQGQQADIDSNLSGLPALFASIFQKKNKNAAATLSPTMTNTDANQDEEGAEDEGDY